MTNRTADKKGSVTIFIMIFFVSMVTLIFAFISGAKALAVKSSSEALFRLWGNSVLAEFDLNLQRRYNIFGFYGMPCDIESKLDFYAKSSFESKKYIDYDGCSCSLYDYSLVNSEVFRKQITEAAESDITEKLSEADTAPVEIEAAAGSKRGTADTLFDDLPSAGSDKSVSVTSIAGRLKNLSDVSDMIKQGSSEYFENQYLFTYFKDAMNSHNIGETYFDNEIEYVICGKKNDKANSADIRAKIIGVREVLNLVYLHKDAAKMAEAAAAANLLTPGPAAIATREVLLASWALAESVNDYKLLINGRRVSFMKNEASWAIDIDSVVNNREEDCVYTGSDEGADYDGYLTAFAVMMDDGVRAVRMMDLIQINMRYLYYDDFRLSDYSSGMRFTAEVNGNDYQYETEY